MVTFHKLLLGVLLFIPPALGSDRLQHPQLELIYQDETDIKPHLEKSYWDPNDAYFFLSGEDHESKKAAKVVALQEPGAILFSNNENILSDNNPHTIFTNAEQFWPHNSQSIRITNWQPTETVFVDFKTGEQVAPSIPSRMIQFNADRTKYLDLFNNLHHRDGRLIGSLPERTGWYLFSDDGRYIQKNRHCRFYDGQTSNLVKELESAPGSLNDLPVCSFLNHGNWVLVQDCFKVTQRDDFGWEYCSEAKVRIFDLERNAYVTEPIAIEGAHLLIMMEFTRVLRADLDQGTITLGYKENPTVPVTLDLVKRRGDVDGLDVVDEHYFSRFNSDTKNFEIRTGANRDLFLSFPGFYDAPFETFERRVFFLGQGRSAYALVPTANFRDHKTTVIRLSDKREITGNFGGFYVAVPNSPLFFHTKEGVYRLVDFDTGSEETFVDAKLWVHPQGRYIAAYLRDYRRLQIYKVLTP